VRCAVENQEARSLRKTLALALVTLVAALGLVASGSAATSKRTNLMREISITNFKANKNGTVTVFVKVRGWKMYPKLVGKKTNKADGGHWHIYVNGKYNTYSANATKGVTTKLKNGDYKITVALANDDHSLVKGTHPSKAVTAMVG
jgi:ABC-type glycerol-3-phosphate transport system substrate-binding protein